MTFIDEGGEKKHTIPYHDTYEFRTLSGSKHVFAPLVYECITQNKQQALHHCSNNIPYHIMTHMSFELCLEVSMFLRHWYTSVSRRTNNKLFTTVPISPPGREIH